MSLTWSKQIEQWMDKNDVVECIDCEKPVAAINDNVGPDCEFRCRSCSRKLEEYDF